MYSYLLVSVVLVILAYLLGSIPTGYLAGKYLKGIDIREAGSGSTGATNVLRNLGKKAAITVLLIDALKGAIAVALVKGIYALNSPVTMPLDWKDWLIIAVAITAVIGHSKSVWINFSGGKSVATSLGVLSVLSPAVALSTLGVFAIVLTLSKIVSLSSISGALAVIVFMGIFKPSLPYLLFATLVGIYVIIRHRSNIQRLMAGTEPKIGKKITQ
jgi:glycerol-3-phosphate acyltransferase PlsY